MTSVNSQKEHHWKELSDRRRVKAIHTLQDRHLRSLFTQTRMQEVVKEIEHDLHLRERRFQLQLGPHSTLFDNAIWKRKRLITTGTTLSIVHPNHTKTILDVPPGVYEFQIFVTD